MKTRCYYKRERSYKHYGARGITVCQEWKDDFASFKSWAEANGYSDGLQIDRINTDGNYEPTNCRWVSAKENSNNKTNHQFITAFGETKNLTEWTSDPRCKVSAHCLRNRIRRGWNGEYALTTSKLYN